jgi:hypothetical protein
VDARRYKLKIDIFFSHELFESLGAFVVELTKLGPQAGLTEEFVALLVGGKYRGAGTAAHWDSMGDVIGIVGIHDQQIIVSVAGGSYEPARLIGADESNGVYDGGVACMGSGAGGQTGWIQIDVVSGAWAGGLGLGRILVLASLV